jgi:hypothetical protein
MGAALALTAGAAEADKSESSAPTAVVAEPEGGAKTAWEQKEAELLTMLKEVVAEQSQAEKGDASIDWNAVEANVKNQLFSEARAEAESKWPHSQFAWVQALQKDLVRQERQEKRQFQGASELGVVNVLEGRLRKEVESLEAPDGAESDQVSNSDDDETRWKFRDKSGSRTTKPRYKGQEPVN